MTAFTCYVGVVKDPDYQWTEENWHCNIPALFSLPGSRELFIKIMEGVREGQYQGMQLDWGAFLGYLTKEEIQELMVRDVKQSEDCSHFPHIRKKAVKLQDGLRTLELGKKYAVVVTEC